MYSFVLTIEYGGYSFTLLFKVEILLLTGSQEELNCGIQVEIRVLAM